MVRPMTHADVVPAADLLRRGAWGERATFFRYALAEPWARPLVAERDGTIVGTGVASAHGPVGWVGTIFVDQAERGRGVGRALTQATMAELRNLGCSTLVLVATEMGRLLYEQLGFETRTFYQTFELEGRAIRDGEPPFPGIDAFAASHVGEAAALDASQFRCVANTGSS